MQDALPTPATRLLRGLTLRCPECGKERMLASWFRLRPSCTTCGLKFDRGSRDYFIGAYLVNLIIAELLFAVGSVVWAVRNYPNIPWDTFQWVAIVLMVTAPVVTYPFTKTLWLAIDLIFVPPAVADRVPL